MKMYNMKHSMRVVAFTMAFAMAITSCLFGSVNAAAAKPKINSIKISKPVVPTLALKKGESYQLRINVKPSKLKKKVKYTSSKSSVVSVDKKGTCRARKAGTAVITVCSTTKPKKKASVKVSVYKKLKKVKKVVLSPSSATIAVGETLNLKTSVTPKKATVKSFYYRSSNKTVANVSGNGIITAKKKGIAVVTAYAKDGRGAKASCKITVRAKGASEGNSSANSSKPGNQATASPQPIFSPTAKPIVEQDTQDTFVIADSTAAVPIYIDSDGQDYDGLSLVAKSFAEDVNLVTNAEVVPSVVTDISELKGSAIIAGSIGNNGVIDELISNGKLEIDDVKGKWEVYKLHVVKNPLPGVERALVIVGSDKRGTIYGIYHLSELMGVSPWVYWGDAVPAKQDKIELAKKDFAGTSEEPSVKYRGIFLNDEAPSLSGWVKEKFGNYNEEFYEHVYELILRLKGNYLWPAMWSNSFSDDGKENKIANAELADKYGIVMGTSHHEPMCRAGVEWQRTYSQYGSSNVWDFGENEEAITEFWRQGVQRNKEFENVITLGMRGEADSSLGGTIEDNIELLKNVITTQKNILQEEGLEEVPQVLTVYKEVEDFWHGTDSKEGLKTWDVLDDVTIMLCDDNFGNMRTLPEKDMQNRAGGWGMYYHFDYHGGPTSYEWVNTTQLNKVWEQMTMAYEYGIDDIWIVNVGDLKPMEMNISYFLDLAYDYDTWGKNGLNKTTDYTTDWVEQQFGDSVTEDRKQDMVTLLKEYTWLNTSCKPETLNNGTYHVTNYNEAKDMLERIEQMVSLAQEVQNDVPDDLQAAYYQLVYFPAVASATVAKIQIYSGLNTYYYEKNMVCANIYAAQLKTAIQEDKNLQSEYNNAMPGVEDKWKNMMSSPHVGFVTWNSEGWKYPEIKWYQPDETSTMIVGLEGQSEIYTEGTASLSDFTSVNKESYTVDLSNQGVKPFTYEVKASADWIKLSDVSGYITMHDSFHISVDWSKVAQDSEGTVTITGAGKTVIVPIKAKVTDTAGLAEKTYIYENGYASIAAGNFTKRESGANGETFEVICDYGKMGDSLKAFPSNRSFVDDVTKAPYVEYTVSVPEAGTYKLTTYTAPSNNVDRNSVTIRYAVAANGGEPQLINSINENNYEAGAYSGTWTTDVKANGRSTESELTLRAGINTIQYYAADPGFVLQKAVVSKESIKNSHFGPKESYYVGKTVSEISDTISEKQLIHSMPGQIVASDYEGSSRNGESVTVKEGEEYTYPVIVSEGATYEFEVGASSEEGAVLQLLWGKRVVGSVQVDATGGTFAIDGTIKLGTIKNSITVKVTSGQAKLDYIKINKSDTSN